MERNALAAYNKHNSERGRPVESRSVHGQQKTTRANEPSKRLGPATILAGKPKHEYVPNSVGQSAEYAHTEKPLKAWQVPGTNGKPMWTTEAAPQRLAFGTSAPRGTETKRTRDLRIWRERVAQETRCGRGSEPPDDELDMLAAQLAYTSARRPSTTPTAFDVATGNGAARAAPQCLKCGQDRFYCPHKARAAPPSIIDNFSAGAMSSQCNLIEPPVRNLVGARQRQGQWRPGCGSANDHGGCGAQLGGCEAAGRAGAHTG
jgi:hypothetical protein